MFVTHARTVVVEAFRAALEGTTHPGLAGKKLWVGKDFPAVSTNYPGVWVEFSPNGGVQSGGIGHVEFRVNETAQVVQGTRWRFSGTITATAVALTSLERDALADELLRMVAFRDEHPGLAILRDHVVDNDLLNINAQWDKATLTAFGDSSGTPWGTDDPVYEVTLSLSCSGDFISILGTEPTVGTLEAVQAKFHGHMVEVDSDGSTFVPSPLGDPETAEDIPLPNLPDWTKDWH